MSAPRHLPPKHGPAYRALLRWSRTLHTYVSMFALVAFTFFAVTGFMLNHPDWFGLDETHLSETDLTLPPDVLAGKDKFTLVEFLRKSGATGAAQPFDWAGEGEPFHVSFKAPGAQCDADITLPGGQTRLRVETRGVAGLMSRLHTAKDAGPVWRLLVDATAVLLVFVCLTGVVLWQSLPKRRTAGAVGLALSVLAIAAAYWVCVP